MRTHLDYDAVIALKLCFTMTSRPSQAVRQQLASSIGVPEKTVTVWFQNRRQRSKARAGVNEDRGCPEACKLLFQDEGETTPWWESNFIAALTAPNSPTSITAPLSHTDSDEEGQYECIDSCELLESVMLRAPPASYPSSDLGGGPRLSQRSPTRESERPIMKMLNEVSAELGLSKDFSLGPSLGPGIDAPFCDGSFNFAACA